ncbi:hypothetical protein JHK85_035936 [Glycine max]|nr:hypothetical protein JHK85_035936 [Glycine max]
MVGCDWLSIKIEEPTEITPDSDVQDSVEVHKEENWMRNDRIDLVWGWKYKPQAYSLMADFMTLIRRLNSNYTRLRCFDLYKLHSWVGGLTEFGDGRNQQSTSEAVNAYYAATLMGLAYGHMHLLAIGSTLTALEILSGTNVVAYERGSAIDNSLVKKAVAIGAGVPLLGAALVD